MPRRPRFVQPGIAHHITQRGNNRQDVFLRDEDRTRYVKILSEHAHRHHLHILAWCLMTNHVHLIAIPSDADSLALALGQAHSQYSLEQNRSRRRVGHLWQNRFFSCPLDSAHLFAAIHYVELNPVRAGMVTEPWEWPWSSAEAHIAPDSRGGSRGGLLDWAWEDWMEGNRLSRWDFDGWRSALTSTPPDGEVDRIRRATRLGEPFGSPAFLADLERQAGRRLRVLRQGRPARESIPSSKQQCLFG